MYHKKAVKGFLLAGVLGMTFMTSGSNVALTTTMAGQTELAGMSYTLEQYITNQQNAGVSDPEAIVAFTTTNANEAAITPASEALTPEQQAAQAQAQAEAQMQAQAEAAQAAAAAQAAQEAAAAQAAQEAAAAQAAQAAPEATPKPESKYKNVGISVAQEYVNIRKKPNTESKVVGKLYRGSAATIVERKGEWVKIRSGKVTGYINKDYLAIGFSAEKLIDDFGTKWATVNTETLKVREEKNTDCTILTLIPEGETYKVIREDKEWVKIEVDGTTKGFVAKEYVKIKVRFKKAVSIEEEEAEARRKAEAAQAAAEAEAAEAARRAEAARQAEAARKAAASAAKKSSSKKKSSSAKKKSSQKTTMSSGNGGSVVGSGNGATIASYALKFVGNPYVYGGTSLTNGTDCSGFTQAVFRRFGISLPRTSGSQAGVGAKISVSNAKAGDLIFYASGGRINHVALCIGNGRVVHASNPSVGITTSRINYRTPYCARRVVG